MEKNFMIEPTKRQKSILKHMGFDLDRIKDMGITKKIYHPKDGSWTIVQHGKNYEFNTLKEAQEFVRTCEEAS